VLEKILSSLKWLIPFNFGFGSPEAESAYSVPQYGGEDAWVASISYVPLISAVILLLRKNNSDFILQHAKQSLILTILALITLVVFSSTLRLLIEAIWVFLIVLSAYKAFSGRKLYIPFITEIARLIEI
jgi:uncharacterized membrane protein